MTIISDFFFHNEEEETSGAKATIIPPPPPPLAPTRRPHPTPRRLALRSDTRVRGHILPSRGFDQGFCNIFCDKHRSGFLSGQHRSRQSLITRIGRIPGPELIGFGCRLFRLNGKHVISCGGGGEGGRANGRRDGDKNTKGEVGRGQACRE